jgi:hypothetical protein
MDVIYWRKDGTSIKLPCADILRFSGDKIKELRIFMDANPIFDTTMAVGPKASVMTVSEGRQAIPPDAMRKYFAEHPEGIQRIAQGLVPKWAIAGPKWPIAPKTHILRDFQGALRDGKLDVARSYLTKEAILRVGNRTEVVGEQAVLDSLMRLFTNELRPSGAQFTAVWEPAPDLLIVEMNVQASRLHDNKSVEYPCVETYRFEGNKIREWRIYPNEATLLAPESLVAHS